MPTLLFCLAIFAAGVIPVIDLDVCLATMSAMTRGRSVGVLVLAATIGQMLGKTLLFFAARGAIRMPVVGRWNRLAWVQEKLTGDGAIATKTLFWSALTGFPPLSFTAVGCGAAPMRLARFWVVGFSGRLLRFSVIATLPFLAISIEPLARLLTALGRLIP